MILGGAEGVFKGVIMCACVVGVRENGGGCEQIVFYLCVLNKDVQYFKE